MFRRPSWRAYRDSVTAGSELRGSRMRRAPVHGRGLARSQWLLRWPYRKYTTRPITAQIEEQLDRVQPRLKNSSRQPAIASGPTTQISGVRNGRWRSGSLHAQHHHAERDHEEREQRARVGDVGEHADREHAPRTATRTTPVMMVTTCGVWNCGCTSTSTSGSRPSRAIVKRMRVWPKIIISTTDGSATMAAARRPSCRLRVQPISRSTNGERLLRLRQRAARLRADRTDRRVGDQQVEDGADRQRADQADRDVAVRVLGFLGRGRDRVEADVGEEDRCRGAEHADARQRGAPAVRAASARSSRSLTAGQREDDESGQRGDLDEHQHRVDLGALGRADHQQAR